MKVLVTGGLGVLGAYVLRWLLAEGHEVVVVDNHENRFLVRDVEKPYELRVVDISNDAADRELISSTKPDAIIHLAGIIAADNDPVAAVRVNIGGTTSLCSAAVNSGVKRFVYMSSRAVYGSLIGEFGHPNYQPVKEDAPFAPIGMYDITKVACEHIGRRFAASHGLEFAAMRAAFPIGPGKMQQGRFSAYHRIIEDPANGRPYALDQGADQRDDLVFAGDVAAALALAATRPVLSYDAYNVASGHLASLQELADTVRAEIPGAQIELGGGLDPNKRGIAYYGTLDCTRAKQDLGWQPRYDLAAMVKEYIASLDRLGLRDGATA